MADHPILTYVAWIASFAVVYVVQAVTWGGFQTWPTFVIFGVFLPIGVIVKARRQTRVVPSAE